MASLRGRVWAGSTASPTAVLAAVEWWWQEGRSAKGRSGASGKGLSAEDAGEGTEGGGRKRRREGGGLGEEAGEAEHGGGGAAWNVHSPPDGRGHGEIEEVDWDEGEGDEQGDSLFNPYLIPI